MIWWLAIPYGLIALFMLGFWVHTQSRDPLAWVVVGVMALFWPIILPIYIGRSVAKQILERERTRPPHSRPLPTPAPPPRASA